jgi:8-oxo-dGTP pyrophosphatase MutT (NUDIX family)
VDFKEFESLLKKAKDIPLPGEEAQIELAPSGRVSLSDMDLDLNKVRKAGVLALVENYQGEAHLILTSRTKYPGAHSGQVSFPGGSFEEEDADFRTTARRETQEEIGVSDSDYEIWGALSPLYIPPSNFLVHPYLAKAAEALSFVAEEKEVAAIHRISINRFLDESAISRTQIKLSNGFKLNSPAFEMDGLVIWGATAMMIAEIRALLLQSRASL